MRLEKLILLIGLSFWGENIFAQFVYKIKTDSLLVTNDSCTAELNLENSTKHVPGFLFNRGNGRTEFRRGAVKINDSLYVFGGDTLKLGNGSGQVPSWQQTLNVDRKTSGLLIFDTSFTKPVAQGGSNYHEWMRFYPLVKADDSVTSPFYMWQYSQRINSKMNEVMRWGWNMGPDGTAMQAGKPALGEGWESNNQSDPSGYGSRFLEKNDLYIKPSGQQIKLSNYTINSNSGSVKYYQTAGEFALRNDLTSTPYFEIQGSTNETYFNLRNSANQPDVFSLIGQYNVSANYSLFSINNGTLKPQSEFRLHNFTNASLPGYCVLSSRHDSSAAIRLQDSAQADLFIVNAYKDRVELNTPTTKTNPIMFNIGSNQAFGITNSHVGSRAPIYINGSAFVTSPTARLDVRNTDFDRTAYFQQSRGTGTNYAAVVTAVGSGSENDALNVTAINATINKAIRIDGPQVGANNWSIYSLATSKSYFNGPIGIKLESPTAYLNLAAGTSTANSAPLKFTSGQNLTTPEAGAVEFDGSNYYVTTGTTRFTLAKTLTASSSLDFPSTAAQSSSDLTITITGAADGDVVQIGVPNASVSANTCYTAFVSASNTITIRFSNYSSGSVDPASGTFRV